MQKTPYSYLGACLAAFFKTTGKGIPHVALVAGEQRSSRFPTRCPGASTWQVHILEYACAGKIKSAEKQYRAHVGDEQMLLQQITS